MNSITICNMALNMLGMPSITSFEETNNSAKLCKQYFPILRDRVLRDHHWSFAAAAVTLQAVADEVPFDPAYVYSCALPGDLIRITRVEPEQPFRKAGNRIYIDTLPATLIYTRRVDDPTLFDDTFCEALQYCLAAEIGMINTRDPQLINFYRSEYERKLAIARSIDSSENRFAYQPSPRRSNFIAARYQSVTTPVAGQTGTPLKWVEGTEGKQK